MQDDGRTWKRWSRDEILQAQGMLGRLGLMLRGGASGMNEWGALFWLASVVAIFSIPFVLFAFLMRLVGRITTRTLVSILAADSVLRGLAVYHWWACRGG